MSIPKLNVIDAETLLATPLPKTMYIVDNLLPQGLSIFCGASKIGKSWLMLDLATKVAKGEPMWGLTTHQSDVLYLTLEDTITRVQERLYKLVDEAPSNLRIAIACEKIGKGLEEQINAALNEYPYTKLIIIDTFQKVRNAGGSVRDGMYAVDYADVSALKEIADKNKIAVMFVHHLRKVKDLDDPFNDVSGSTGIAGAADTPYELRHTFVSIVKALPEGHLKQLVGHSKDMDTYGVYSHEFGNDRAAAAAMVQDIFNKIIKE